VTDTSLAPRPVEGQTDALLVADADRRFYAFVIDTLAVAGAMSAAAYAAQAPAAVLGAVALVGVFGALLAGGFGVTPGKALLGLRVLSVEDARPIGFPRAALRTAILGMATLPTAGLGAAALARTALVDPSGWRRGWHDLRTGSVVVDVRTTPVLAVPPVEPPQTVVNLTAMRLVPAAPTPPEHADLRGPRQTAPTAPARWQVAFDTGEAFEVRGVTLVGRQPEARAGEPAPLTVALPSGDLSLSKTHAQFEVAPDGALVVMDRGSTNGSTLIRQGVTKALVGGRPATLRDGDRVRFGDREMRVARLS